MVNNNSIEFKPIRMSDVAMKMLCNTLWAVSSKKSIVSGLWLRSFERTELFSNLFLHVLTPDKYPCFTFYYGNVILVTPGEHALWKQASEEERIQYSLSLEEQSKGKATADWGVIKRLEASLDVLYKKHFPSTKGMLLNYYYTFGEIKDKVGALNKKFLSDIKK